MTQKTDLQTQMRQRIFGGGRLGIWCVNLKDTQEKIGTCVLLPIPIEEDDTDWHSMVADRYPDAQVEVGYILAKSAWGQGIASETCTRLLQFAFEHTDLSEVIGLTYMGHVVSQHVLKKCGLTYQKRSRAYACDDVDWFEISRDAWTARTA